MFSESTINIDTIDIRRAISRAWISYEAFSSTNWSSYVAHVIGSTSRRGRVEKGSRWAHIIVRRVGAISCYAESVVLTRGVGWLCKSSSPGTCTIDCSLCMPC